MSLNLVPRPKKESIIRELPNVTQVQHVDAGGMKFVYQATINGQLQALKLFPLRAHSGKTYDSDTEQAEISARAIREINALSRCSCTNLVKLGSMSPIEATIENIEYIVYTEEWLDGPDLDKLINDQSIWPDETELVQLLISLTKAIADIWAIQHIHRDIKPKNIIKLNDVNRPFVLLDLSVAYSLADTGITVSTDIIPGTVPYLSPEMLVPGFRENIDFRSDLYSAGVTIFEYACKSHPLMSDGDDTRILYRKIKQAESPPLRSVRQDLSPQFCNLIDQLQKKHKHLRPSSLDALIKRLEKFQ